MKKSILNSRVLKILISVSCLQLAISAIASDNTITNARITESHLYQDSQWLALLHMQKKKFLSGYNSEVDNPSFFLSGASKDPYKELLATINQFDKDPSTWCVFPARGSWLVKHGLIAENSSISCPELDQWRHAFPAKQLVLVFPSVYLNSASSMFGHTFLRFENPAGSLPSPLLSKAVSYYADMNGQEESFAHLYKGVFGGFKGTLDVMPYYEMMRKYNANEDRDIWEYTLNYEPRDITFLIDHLWELRGHSFDYYFFDENCSYRIISFLDVITPGNNMSNSFDGYVTPIDTIRALKKKGEIKNATYIPSATKYINEEIKLTSEESIKKIHDFIYSPGIESADSLTHSEMIIAMQVLNLSVHKHGVINEEDKKIQALSSQILSTSPEKSLEKEPANTALYTPPENGHLNRKIQMGYGYQHNIGNYSEFEWQETYHDFYDPPDGYEKGVTLTGPALIMRHSDKKDWQLEKLNLLSIASLNPVNTLFKPLSWQLNINRQQEFIKNHEVLVNNADLLLGMTFNDAQGIYWFAMGGGGVSQATNFSPLFIAHISTQMGALYQNTPWTVYTGWETKKYLVDSIKPSQIISLSVNRALVKDLSLHMQYKYHDESSMGANVISAGISWYF